MASLPEHWLVFSTNSHENGGKIAIDMREVSFFERFGEKITIIHMKSGVTRSVCITFDEFGTLLDYYQ